MKSSEHLGLHVDTCRPIKSRQAFSTMKHVMGSSLSGCRVTLVSTLALSGLLGLGCDQNKTNSKSQESHPTAKAPEAKDADDAKAKGADNAAQDAKESASDAAKPAESDEPPVGFPAGGIWQGSFEHEDHPGTFAGVILEDGRVGMRTSLGGVLWGKFEVAKDKTSLTGSLRSFKDGKGGPHYDIEGKVTPAKEIKGVVSLKDEKDAKKYSFQWNYSGGYAVAAGEPPLTGSWGPEGEALTFAEDGTVSGKTFDGCTYEGKATQLDKRFAAYDFFFDLKGCHRPGHFSGVLALGTKEEPHDALHYVVEGQHLAASGYLLRVGSEAAKEKTKN